MTPPFLVSSGPWRLLTDTIITLDTCYLHWIKMKNDAGEIVDLYIPRKWYAHSLESKVYTLCRFPEVLLEDTSGCLVTGILLVSYETC